MLTKNQLLLACQRMSRTVPTTSKNSKSGNFLKKILLRNNNSNKNTIEAFEIIKKKTNVAISSSEQSLQQPAEASAAGVFQLFVFLSAAGGDFWESFCFLHLRSEPFPFCFPASSVIWKNEPLFHGEEMEPIFTPQTRASRHSGPNFYRGAFSPSSWVVCLEELRPFLPFEPIILDVVS